MNGQPSESPKTPQKIEQEKIKFRIPLYQRPYAWEEKQVKQLLYDLAEAFGSNKEEDYHIGILSVARTPDDKARFDLIDGQQRIVTLMLIGKAASTYYEPWKTFLADNRLDLYGRKDDQAFLESGKSTNKVSRLLIDASKTATDYFNIPKLSEEAAKKKFSRYIYEHAAFFVSEVPSEYTLLDKNQQFVRMNNRGRQLEKHEILKVRLVSKIYDPEQLKKFTTIWNNMLADLNDVPERNGLEQKQKNFGAILEDKPPDGKEDGAANEPFYKAITTIPEFLLIALNRYLRNKAENFTFNDDKLIETFDDVFKFENAKTKETEILKFIGVLEKQVTMLRSYFIFSNDEGKKIRQYKFLGEEKDKKENVYNNYFTDDERKWKQRLIAVQSFLHVSTEPHHWLVPAFNWCEEKSKPEKIDAKEFINQLEQIDNDLISEETRKLSPIDNLKKMSYGNISHYWFYRLDYELWKSYQAHRADDKGLWSHILKDVKAKLFENFRFRRCSSVEHIYPQNPPEKSAISREEILHSFGNLALISSSRNSRFSNSYPGGKKDIIINSEYTESLKMAYSLWSGNCEDDKHVQDTGMMMYNFLRDAVPDAADLSQN